MRLKWQVLSLAAAILTIVICIDFSLQSVVEKSGLLAEPVDIQSESALYAKVRYFQTAPAKRIALIGDSTSLGLEMAEWGEPNWRSHTFDQLIRERFAGIQTSVVNFAVTAAEPLDFSKFTKMILSARPDLVMIGISLASFSTSDAKGEKEHYCRTWLKPLEILPDGELQHFHSEPLPFSARIDESLRSYLLEHWFAYRIRDFLQWRYFSGPPAEVMRRTEIQLRDYFKGESGKDPKEELDRALTKARHHYATIDLKDSAEQVRAFLDLLKLLELSKQKTIVFFVPLNPELLPRIVDPKLYQESRTRLKEILAGASFENLVTVMDPVVPEPSAYYDHIHFKKKGFADYMRANLDRVLTH